MSEPAVVDSSFVFSGFGDEIASELEEQLAALQSLGINYIELRGIWGKNIADLDEEELRRLQQGLRASGMRVSSIASPIGKTPIDLPFAPQLELFRRILHIASAVGAPFVRIFSFYLPEASSQALRPVVLERLSQLVQEAESWPVTLLHENEKGIYGETPERCADILTAIDSPKLMALFDPANFVQVDVERPFDRAWPLYGQKIRYVHVKDAKLGSGEVVVAGAGDGQVRELLRALRGRGPITLSLEPHLALGGLASGFSGKQLFSQALDALQELLKSL